MSSRPTKKAKHESVPVLGSVNATEVYFPKYMREPVPFMDPRIGNPLGYFGEHPTILLFQAIIQYNDVDKVKECIENGASINHYDVDGKTPLMHCFGRHPEIYKILIDKGADVSREDNLGNTALVYAVMYSSDNFRFAESLIKVNPSLINMWNKKGRTPLWIMVSKYEYDEENKVQWLLDHGADPNVREFGRDGKSVCRAAVDSIFIDGEGRRYDDQLANLLTILFSKRGNPKTNIDFAKLKLDRLIWRIVTMINESDEHFNKSGQLLIEKGAFKDMNDLNQLTLKIVSRNRKKKDPSEWYPFLEEWL
jgi:hypothetical protein